MKTVTVTLPLEEAERLLRDAAYEAAKNSSLADFITRRTYNAPVSGIGVSKSLDDWRKIWRDRFLAARRVIQCFGVDYEPVSEEETLTVGYRYTNPNKKGMVSVDYDQPVPEYWRGVHAAACDAAADRVVRAWRRQLELDEAEMPWCDRCQCYHHEPAVHIIC